MSEFKGYIVRRTVYAIITLFLTITINFFIFRVMPGDPVSIMVSERILKPSVVEEVRAMFGLNLPLWQQYILYIRNLLIGYFGYSFHWKEPVINVIMERMPNTILLMGVSTILSVIIGIVLGVLAAWKRGTKVDVTILTSSLMFYSLPVFWIGMMLLMLFGYYLGIFPIAGTMSRPPPEGFFERILDLLHHMTLPTITLTLISYGEYTLLMRGTLLDVLTQDYIVTARAKGLSERRVLVKHAMRNALLPTVTAVAISLGFIVSGATLTETVFSWNGVGRLIYDAMMMRDYPVLQGAFLIISISVILANYVADIVYGILDPRIRYGGQGA
ncbi:MAG: ABC transporter permease [archaeon YNP-LCB-003-016]|jgi:peptide/nickel transport system permease protein|uniref:ABC transporter permease n=1 Tax=Candidatus Culexarchaeum yellowstonense TaxID=2928963 RepID=UPI0026F0C724|nr:ABC transporter permease [Candidatus Culexarchaeum yellowstonense]MCR6692274.1 ABC transporter permease [Candidatus Culexarchaeum yellowstonense]